MHKLLRYIIQVFVFYIDMSSTSIKVAYLISGITRNYIYSSHSFKKYIFDNCPGDVFVSFKRGTRTHYLKNEIIEKIPAKERININDNIDDLTFLKYLFASNLKYFNYDDEEYIEQMKATKISNLQSNINNHLFVLDQFARVKNIAEKFEIYKNRYDVSYDVVVRIRLDRIWWINNINIQDYIVDKNKIYISYIDWKKSKYNEFTEWAQDFIFMGDTNLMLYIMKDFFDNIYNSSDFILEDKMNISAEIQFANYINSNKILENKIVNSDIRFTLAALHCDRPLYLSGYLVGTAKNVYNQYKKWTKNKSNSSLPASTIKRVHKIEMSIS
jgi:hypothetical protein